MKLFRVISTPKTFKVLGSFCKLGNIDVGVNVDVQSHPVGHHTPQTLCLVSLVSNEKSALIVKGKYQDKITANIFGNLLLWTSFFCGVVDPTG